MSDLDAGSPSGILGRNWFGMVGDYAIAGGWILDCAALVIGDSAGGGIRI